MVDCGDIFTVAAELQEKFKKCKKLSAADMDLLVDLIIAVRNCTNGALIQDNQAKEISFGLVVESGGIIDLADRVNNSIGTHVVNDDEIPIFTGLVYKEGSIVASLNKYMILGNGKGTYGLGGDIVLTNSDFLLIEEKYPIDFDPDADDPNANVIDLGALATGSTLTDALALINAADPAYNIQAGTNWYFEYSIDSLRYLYGFKGTNGSYGLNNLQMDSDDLFLVFDETSGSANSSIPNLKEVLLSGNISDTADLPLIIEDKGGVIVRSPLDPDYVFSRLGVSTGVANDTGFLELGYSDRNINRLLPGETYDGDYYLPTKDLSAQSFKQTLAISVNGILADDTGNITVPPLESISESGTVAGGNLIGIFGEPGGAFILADGAANTLLFGATSGITFSNDITLGTNSIDTVTAKETADCGTVIPLDTVGGHNCNMGSANATESYTISELSGDIVNAWTQVLINAVNEPAIAGATQEGGIEFIANTDMYLNVRNKGIQGNVYYYLPIETSEFSDLYITSDTTDEPAGSDQILNIVSLTQAEYDAGTPVATTFYIITD